MRGTYWRKWGWEELMVDWGRIVRENEGDSGHCDECKNAMRCEGGSRRAQGREDKIRELAGKKNACKSHEIANKQSFTNRIYTQTSRSLIPFHKLSFVPHVLFQLIHKSHYYETRKNSLQKIKTQHIAKINMHNKTQTIWMISEQIKKVQNP